MAARRALRGLMRGIERAVAVAGPVIVAVALVLLWVIRLSVPRDLYVSELGATGMPTARPFEVFLLLIVAGGALIAWAGRGVRARSRLLASWAPAVSIWVACGFLLIASQVTCTAGCPVPVPGPSFTWQDFVHTSSAVLAFAAAAVAILQCAFAEGRPMLRRLSLASALGVGLISAAGGLMSLFDFYPWFGSRLEILATTIGLGWLVVFGVTLAFARSAPASAAALHRIQQPVRQHDEAVDLALIAVDPPHLGLGPDRHEAVVLLPDHERALGPEHVLLPPHLPQIVPGDAAPR
jgi:hypothetical protein